MSAPSEITPLSEVLRLAVEGSPVASIDYRVMEIVGSSDEQMVAMVAMARHEARVQAYATLAKVTYGQAAQYVQQAAEHLCAKRDVAVEAWDRLCEANNGDHLSTFSAAHDQTWTHEFAVAAGLNDMEALGWLLQKHMPVCNHHRH